MRRCAGTERNFAQSIADAHRSQVEYTITQGAKGWQAQDVTGPNGSSLAVPSHFRADPSIRCTGDWFTFKWTETAITVGLRPQIQRRELRERRLPPQQLLPAAGSRQYWRNRLGILQLSDDLARSHASSSVRSPRRSSKPLADLFFGPRRAVLATTVPGLPTPIASHVLRTSADGDAARSPSRQRLRLPSGSSTSPR